MLKDPGKCNSGSYRSRVGKLSCRLTKHSETHKNKPGPREEGRVKRTRRCELFVELDEVLDLVLELIGNLLPAGIVTKGLAEVAEEQLCGVRPGLK